MKWKAFFIICKGLSSKEIKRNFFGRWESGFEQLMYVHDAKYLKSVFKVIDYVKHEFKFFLVLKFFTGRWSVGRWSVHLVGCRLICGRLVGGRWLVVLRKPQWRMMKNLKRNCFVISKLRWGIWQILTWALKNLKNLLFNGFLLTKSI